MKDVPTETIKRLTDLHIRRYENRLAAKRNEPTSPLGQLVNKDQCMAYLALWKGIEAKGYEWLKLETMEKREVMDALADEE